MSTQLLRRGARHVVAVVAIIASGWLIMAIIGLISMVRTEADGFHILDLPDHPVALGVAYGIGAVLFPVLAVWMMTPRTASTRISDFALRLIFSYFGAGVVALLIFGIVLWNI